MGTILLHKYITFALSCQSFLICYWPSQNIHDVNTHADRHTIWPSAAFESQNNTNIARKNHFLKRNLFRIKFFFRVFRIEFWFLACATQATKRRRKKMPKIGFRISICWYKQTKNSSVMLRSIFRYFIITKFCERNNKFRLNFIHMH